MTSGAGRTVVYASFNKPSSISRGTSVLLFTHDAEHNRIKQEVLGAQTTLYLNDPISGVRAERLPLAGGGTDWNNYIFAGGNMVVHPGHQ
jgi:hypothetical protein